LINVDTVASAISILSDTQEKGCYHLISPKSISMNSLIKSASEYFNFEMPKIVPFDKYDIDALTPTQKALMLPFYPYFNYTATIIANKTSNILLDHGFKTLAIDQNNLNRIFRYCVSSGFIRM